MKCYLLPEASRPCYRSTPWGPSPACPLTEHPLTCGTLLIFHSVLELGFPEARMSLSCLKQVSEKE